MKWVVGCGKAVLGRVRIATAGLQLRDSLNTDVEGIHLLSEDALRHTLTQVLHQKSRTAILWDREGVESHTVFPIKETQRTDSGSKPVGG